MPISKKCPEGKIINPKTGRCINPPKTPKPKTPKPQNPGQSNLTDYTLGKVLGQGAFGKVVKATHKQTGQQVAIKFQTSMHTSRMFLDEIKVLQKLSGTCKPLVCILGYGHQNGKYFIIMEFIDGMELEKFIDTVSYDDQAIIKIITQLVFGLQALHKSGFAHLDIKPANIMINPVTLEVKIVDLGLACDTNQCGKAGTPIFMEPGIRGSLKSRQSGDIWALGIVLLMMIIGIDKTYSLIRSRKINQANLVKLIKDPVLIHLSIILLNPLSELRLYQFSSL